MTLGIGGWIFHGQPMALVRGLIRRGVRDLTLIPSPGSVAPDMLIGAGCVKTTGCVFISFEHLGLAPNFRRAAQSGAVKVLEMDGPGIAGGLRAGACDLPYGLIPDLGTDLPKVNPGGLSQGARAGRRPAAARSAGDQARRGDPPRPAGRRGRQRAVFRRGLLRPADGAGGQARDLLGRPSSCRPARSATTPA